MSRRHLIAILLVGAVIGTVAATTITSTPAQSTPDPMPQRYQIFFAVGTGTGADGPKRVILLDSATGETWNLDAWKSWVAIPKKGD